MCGSSKTKKETVRLTLNPVLKKRAEKLALRKKISLSRLVAEVLRDYCDLKKAGKNV